MRWRTPWALGVGCCEIPEGVLGRERHCLCPWWAADHHGECPVHSFPPLVVFQSAEQIPVLCRSFNDTQTDSMEGPREGEEATPRPLARHLSDADRLRKVIQELVDTEKSYVKVMEDADPSCPLALPSMASHMLGGVSRSQLPGTPPLRRETPAP